jgi:hypothetical protein
LLVESNKATDSRMLDSDGCATINGGGFSEIVLYSLVSYPLLALVPNSPVIEDTCPFVRCPTRHCVVVKRLRCVLMYYLEYFLRTLMLRLFECIALKGLDDNSRYLSLRCPRIVR